MERKKYKWNAELYDGQLQFVSELGKNLLGLLQPQSGERILDLGCGTGDLTFEISQSGATVVGMDFSEEMISKAHIKYPNLHFFLGNGESFRTNQPYDAIFSNAALHWMKRAADVVESVYLALKKGGRFVAEFGGKGNVDTIYQALWQALEEEYGIDATSANPWYFPSIGEYSAILEKQGFRVIYARHFDRPTPLNDGENGLIHWLDAFSADFYQNLSTEQREHIYHKTMEKTKSKLYKDGVWYADYKRIQIVAIKE